MITIADIDFFGIVARSASLAAAARELGVTPSAVTQRLRDLERRVGVALMVRRGRRLQLTDEGDLLLARGGVISDEVADLRETLAARRGAVVGHLRVAAPFGFGRRYVAPISARFRARYEAITLDLHLTDRLANLPDRAWDVAVHIGEGPPNAYPPHLLAPNDRLLCASPDLVARFGRPEAPEQLPGFPCIALRENDEDVSLWRLQPREGAAVAVRVNPVLASNDGDVVREWALAGLGIIVRSEWSIADDLRAGRLMRLLEDYRLPSADVVALIGPRRGHSARVAAFVQFLREALDPVPWRVAAPA